MPQSPAEWLNIVNGLLLLALTIRAFWGWIFSREHADADHARHIAEAQHEIRRLRERAHDLATEISKLKIQVGVLEERVESVRHHFPDRRSHDRGGDPRRNPRS